MSETLIGMIIGGGAVAFSIWALNRWASPTDPAPTTIRRFQAAIHGGRPPFKQQQPFAVLAAPKPAAAAAAGTVAAQRAMPPGFFGNATFTAVPTRQAAAAIPASISAIAAAAAQAVPQAQAAVQKPVQQVQRAFDTYVDYPRRYF